MDRGYELGNWRAEWKMWFIAFIVFSTGLPWCDILRNGCTEWNTRCQLLLLSGLPRPKGTQEHPSHACVPTRLPVPQLPETDHSDNKGGPVRGAQLAHISTKTLDRRPLSSTGISCTIVVDALDECVDDQPSSALLSVLGRHVSDLRSVKFFITGRPEPRIRSGFRLPLLEPLTQVFLLHGVELSRVDEDIRLYLREKLGAVAKRRSDLDLPDQWPSDDDLTALTKKLSGLFIFASTLVKFIESEDHEPKERLRLIVALPDNTAHEGRAGIDLLYTQVFTHAFSGIKQATVVASLRRVLGAVVLAFNPLSRVQISGILGLDGSLIATALRRLHSVLLIPNEGLGRSGFFTNHSQTSCKTTAVAQIRGCLSTLPFTTGTWRLGVWSC